MTYFVYILECSDRTLYTGIAKDIEKRIEQHESGNGSKYVRSRLPVKLVFSQDFGSRSEALKAEIMIKGLSRLEKERLIRNSFNMNNQD
jgi:putative endonuclease